MIVIPKKDFPKLLNPMGLKRGDTVEIEVADANGDFITLDPATLKLKTVRNIAEPREPIAKMSKPKLSKPSMANMPLPDLKTMLQNSPASAPAASPLPPMPPMK